MKKSKGFTLLELIIVIIVIGILVTMVIPQFVNVAERAYVAKAKANLDAIRKAEALYYGLESGYTIAFSLLQRDIPEVTSSDGAWTYTLSTGSGTFTATAARAGSGRWAGCTVIINQMGNIYGTHNLL